VPHCSALCNDSSLSYQPSSGSYTRIGESTELALRVFVEKVGLNVSARTAWLHVGWTQS
jgi:Ca2+ transporting ATPase